jgi:hypothetical protein
MEVSASSETVVRGHAFTDLDVAEPGPGETLSQAGSIGVMTVRPLFDAELRDILEALPVQLPPVATPT